MREDIARVVVERPRTGGTARTSRAYRESVAWDTLVQEGREDESPGREPMFGAKWGWGDRKQLNDFLSPIRGFLRKSVGRSWNDVWSEVTALLKPVSVMQRHVLEHVRDYVEVHTVRQPDGSVTDSRGRRLRSYFNRGAFYVDPDDGTLCQIEAEPRRAWRNSHGYRPVRAVDPERPYLRDDHGAWFEVELRPLPVTSVGWIVRGNLVSQSERDEMFRKDKLSIIGSGPGFALGTAWDVWFQESAGAGRTHRLPLRTGLSRTIHELHGLLPYSSIDAVPDDLRVHWKDGGVLYCAAKRQLGKKDKKRLGLQ